MGRLKKQLAKRLTNLFLQHILQEFNEGLIDSTETAFLLQIGRTHLYRLRTRFLSERSHFAAKLSGGEHWPDWPPEALVFLQDHTNVIFHGGVGLGKTHLASALGYTAALAGHSVLFTTAVDIINTLTAAQAVHRLKAELKRFVAPRILCIDEVGYLPIDKIGADLLFQVISQRYEKGSIVLTTNQPFKSWPKLFNNDCTLTSAVLDRLLHHAETVVLEGRSYRMKDQIEAP